MKLAAALALSFLFASSSSATDIDYYNDKAHWLWKGFACSILKKFPDTEREKDPHFQLGYANGLELAEAINRGELRTGDLGPDAPQLLIPSLQGPSPDFILGRAFQLIKDDVQHQLNSGPYASSASFAARVERFYKDAYKCDEILLEADPF